MSAPSTRKANPHSRGRDSGSRTAGAYSLGGPSGGGNAVGGGAGGYTYPGGGGGGGIRCGRRVVRGGGVSSAGGGACSSGSGNGSRRWTDLAAGAACGSGASAQNQLPGAQAFAPLGVDCADAVAGRASAKAMAAVEERRAFVMTRYFPLGPDRMARRLATVATLTTRINLQSKCHPA